MLAAIFFLLDIRPGDISTKDKSNKQAEKQGRECKLGKHLFNFWKFLPVAKFYLNCFGHMAVDSQFFPRKGTTLVLVSVIQGYIRTNHLFSSWEEVIIKITYS